MTTIMRIVDGKKKSVISIARIVNNESKRNITLNNLQRDIYIIYIDLRIRMMEMHHFYDLL